MFPSVRRVVVASSTAPPLSSSASTAAAAAGVTLGRTTAVCRGPQQPTLSQRRYSSSKPSSPDNGSKALAGSVPSTSESETSATSSATSATASAAPSTATSTPKRKRKAKEAKEATRSVQQKLPSVPSTQHLPIETLALSTFFSQHRPISITHSLPKIVTDDAFAAIFAPRGRSANGRGGSKTSDVIRTLTRAVHDLETPMANMSVNGTAGAGRRDKTVEEQIRQRQRQIQQQQQQQQQEQQQAAAAEGADTIELKNADGSETGIHMQVSALSGQYLPFQPPPVPMPMATTTAEVAEAAEAAEAMEAELDAADAADAAAEAADASMGTGNGVTSRVFKAVLNFEEQVGEDGQVHIVANSLQILEEGEDEMESSAASGSVVAKGEATVPRSFLERMALRQLRYDDALQRQREAHQEEQLQDKQQRPALDRDGDEAAQPDMQAISVRRQKKLKIKKKKYKKLMRRTRNERRRLDRL